ncbi:LOW QUALITY PROTEIN: reverse transcriptase [Phytophthora megakarya]|uniref:Reverse transcriptase n=1 Tax=Phytophthora megakarya TaxID=4795 RepID=A0A225VHM9_9STRA|nr:LOW QUALITY PROTEIN: reverse transcriptase [Phytophthora megakarya]
MDKVGYLGHRVSVGGLEANPKDLKSLTDLPFPGSLRSMQSRFIEDYAIYASVLYELREVEFAELEKRSDLRKIMDRNDPVPRDLGPPELKLTEPVDERWIRAHRAFTALKTKIATTLVLRHFDEARTPVFVVYASDWAISASTRRDLSSGGVRQSHLEDERVELQCDREGGVGIAEDLGSLLQYAIGTRDPGPNEAFYIVLAVQVDGIAGPPRTMVRPLGSVDARDHEVHEGRGRNTGGDRGQYHPEGEDGQRSDRNRPRKEPKRRIQAPIPTVDREEELWVVSFDGSARVKRGGGALSAIVWSLPRWEVVKVRSGYLESLTVNEAEYNGLILGLGMLKDLDPKYLVVCGDSNLVIRQCMSRETGTEVPTVMRAPLCNDNQEVPGYQDLITLNRLDEILIPRTENPVVRVAAVTTRAGRARSPAGVMQEDLIREMRVDRIKQAQEEEVWILGMKKYLSGSIADLTQAEARSYGKIAADYEVDEQDLLFYCPPTPRSGDNRDRLLRLVVPETCNRTYYTTITPRWKEDIRDWGIPTSGSGITSTGGDYIGRYVAECVDCETGKRKPVIRGESPGNLQATYPFPIIAMDHIPSLPRSHKGNTKLLIWVDLFTGYVIAKASAYRSAQTVAESYEECVFRRFGASEIVRHDREPGFTSDFFRAFNKILGQRQRATMAYRPQANGTAERMVQTATRALKMYVRDLDQKDWDEYAERLTFAINTTHDRIRGDTPHYLVHGWDPRSTLEATLPVGCARRRDRDARRWRYRVQRYYQQSREQVNARLKEAIADRAGRQNEDVGSHKIEAGSHRVKEGYARKLAHMWHGPFRVAEKINEFSVKLEIAGTGYQIFPVVHVSKLKLVKDFPDQPRVELTVEEADRLDFDEILLPEDIWVSDLGADEYEVERIFDVRSGKKTRFGRIYREFLVHWAGYDEPTWVDEADLNCVVILSAFLRERANRNGFNVMQSHE